MIDPVERQIHIAAARSGGCPSQVPSFGLDRTASAASERRHSDQQASLDPGDTTTVPKKVDKK